MNAYFLATINVNLCGVSLLFCRTLWGEAHVLKHRNDQLLTQKIKLSGVKYCTHDYMVNSRAKANPRSSRLQNPSP